MSVPALQVVVSAKVIVCEFGCRTNTLDSLVDLELVERRLKESLVKLDWEWRITDEGRSILPEWARR